MERVKGLEPSASTLARWRSTTELRPLADPTMYRLGPLLQPGKWLNFRVDSSDHFPGAKRASRRYKHAKEQDEGCKIPCIKTGRLDATGLGNI